MGDINVKCKGAVKNSIISQSTHGGNTVIINGVDYVERCNSLQAENTRLREALQDIADLPFCDRAEVSAELARDALKEAEQHD